MRRPADLGKALARPLTLVDVGVRWGFAPRWLDHRAHAQLIGFDADARECERLATRCGLRDALFVPVALGRCDGTATLHVALEPGSSSLLVLDPEAASARPALEDNATAATAPVTMRTLAGWAAEAGVELIDAIKLDVQGAELDVLVGAGALLAGVRAVDVEVEFNPVYRGQPLFGDVDRLLRDTGFVLWTLDNLHFHAPRGAARRVLRHRRTNFDGFVVERAAGPGQLYWAQASYVRPEAALGRPMSPEALLRDALVADALGLDDLTVHLLDRLGDERNELGAAARSIVQRRLRADRARRLLWTGLHRDVPGAARRLVRVRRLARRGLDPDAISAETGLTVPNVCALLRSPWPAWVRRRP